MPKGSKVLMADDDKMLIDMYNERLQLAGYQVTICRNGEEAITKVKETKPDIILLDIMMPKLNGYETLASIKSDPTTKDIPIIMLSALMRDFNREKAVEAGADDYLIKSEAMPADVITKIEQVLQKYQKGNPGSSINTPLAANPSSLSPAPSTPVVSSIAESTSTAENVAAPNTLQNASPQVKNPATPVINFQPESTITPTPLKNSPEKKSSNTLLIIILTILLTTLINDALLYFFLILKK